MYAMEYTWRTLTSKPLEVVKNMKNQYLHTEAWRGTYKIISRQSEDKNITDEDEYSHEQNHLSKASTSLCSRTAIVIALAITLILEITALAIPPSSPNKAPTPPTIQPTVPPAINPINCGTNASTSLSAGCIFNPLTIAWESPACYTPYEDIIDSFLTHKNWSISTDPAGHNQVSWSTVSLAQQRYHAEWDYHFTHCIYAWKIMQRAMEQRLPLSGNLLDVKHTRHCLDVLRDRRWGGEKGVDMHTLIHVKWPKCYAVAEWKDASYSDPFT